MTIDYLSISLFGLKIVKSSGWFDFPKIKRPYSHVWSDSHGIDIDLLDSFIEPRPITIEMSLTANSVADYIAKLTLFQEFIQQPGLRVLKRDKIDRPYFVYLEDMVEIDQKTKFTSTIIASTFRLKFIEKNPVGRYFATTNPIQNVGFTISCAEPITVLWGDGTSQIVQGSNVAVSHIYNPNLLGASGDCDSFVGWAQGTATLVTTDGVSGGKCFEVVSGVSANMTLTRTISSFSSANYLCSVFTKLIAGANASLNLQGVNAIYSFSNAWTRIGREWPKYISTTNPAIYLTGSVNSTARFDNFMINKISKAESKLLTNTQLLDKYAYNNGSTSSGAYINYVGLVGNISKITLLTNLTGLTEIV